MSQRYAQPAPGSSRAARKAAYELKVRVAGALDTARKLLQEHADHLILDEMGVAGWRWIAPNTLPKATAVMERYFAPVNGVVSTMAPYLPHQVEKDVREHFVLVCEMEGVQGTYGQRADWYQEVLESPRVRLELTRRGLRKNRR